MKEWVERHLCNRAKDDDEDDAFPGRGRRARTDRTPENDRSAPDSSYEAYLQRNREEEGSYNPAGKTNPEMTLRGGDSSGTNSPGGTSSSSSGSRTLGTSDTWSQENLRGYDTPKGKGRGKSSSRASSTPKEGTASPSDPEETPITQYASPGERRVRFGDDEALITPSPKAWGRVRPPTPFPNPEEADPASSMSNTEFSPSPGPSTASGVRAMIERYNRNQEMAAALMGLTIKKEGGKKSPNGYEKQR